MLKMLGAKHQDEPFSLIETCFESVSHGAIPCSLARQPPASSGIALTP